MPERARVRQVFLGASALAPEARGAYLGEACDGDVGLRRRVEDLLAAHDRDARADAARERAPAAPGDDPIPERIGAHRIVGRIGSGGMGVVYEAEQEHPRRPIALKVLHGWLLAGESRRRFEQEARVLARIDHPGIARVLEAGEGALVLGGHAAATVPFIAMELVPGGRPITGHARERRLAPGDRLELLAQAAEAVHAAHQKGIIHRDLKPANILVGAPGGVKVIDFGIARWAGGEAPTLSMHTGAGAVFGTLAYMSPEQCAGRAGDADVRSDVYSLGVILYELVCGRPPHDLDGLTPAAAARAIEERPPAPVRAEGRRPARALEAVVLKALAKRPDDRYASAADLARDLRRVLSGAPVDARPPGPWTRLARWIGRHPVAATTAVCLLVGAAVTGATLGALNWLAFRADRVHQPLAGGPVLLESRAGYRLRVWDPGTGGSLTHVGTWALPDALGGGRAIAIASRRGVSADLHPGHLGLYRMSRPSHPMWTTEQAPLIPPGEYAERREAGSEVGPVLAADVFSDAPGLEVVAVQAWDPYSPCAVRIFDLSGQLRYEVWHDGPLSSVAWCAGPRRLVLAGYNCEQRWDERDQTRPLDRYPAVVLGLRPADGHVARGSWVVANGRRLDDTLEFYRWLGPISAVPPSLNVGLLVTGAVGTWDPSESISLHAVLRWHDDVGTSAGFTMTLDADGRILDRWDDDGYKVRVRAGELPPCDVFDLLEYETLPPSSPSP